MTGDTTIIGDMMTDINTTDIVYKPVLKLNSALIPVLLFYMVKKV